MRKLSYILFVMVLFVACGNKAKTTETSLETDTTGDTIVEQPVIHQVVERERCFVVISKRDLNLRVYEATETDTLLVAEYPVCMGKNRGHKEKSGDMRTPESTLEKPFIITEIKDASKWTHDFHDGRGEILAYGHWFMRLKTGFSGIGIHGSTNNETSVPGRASEGCIRLLDKDIIDFKENYAFKDMKVIVKAEDEGLFGFEK